MTSQYDESILRSLRRITRAIALHSRQLAATHRLTIPQLVCLRRIATAGVTTPGKLARDVSLSQATVTGILDRLAARGLVRRSRDESDRRRVNVELTDRGTALADAAPPPLQQEFSRRLGELPDDEQALFDGVLARIVEMMEAQDLDAAPMLAAGSVIAEQADGGAITGEDRSPHGRRKGEKA